MLDIMMKLGAYLILLSLVLLRPAFSDTSPSDADPDIFFVDVYRDLRIAIPASVARDPMVWTRLDELRREPCDQQAIIDLAKSLNSLGYRRQAADALMHFVDKCGNPVEGYRMATNIYMKLSDYDNAIVAADALVRRESTSHNNYYLRARALSAAKYYEKALDDYVSVIELFNDKKRISSNVFVEQAEAYDALGRPCEAMSAIRTWVSFDPEFRETSQARRLIESYASKGRCAETASESAEKFPLKGANRVVEVTAAINGVKGKFILDTGASFLSVSSSFSQKAGLDPNKSSRVVLHTANGDTEGMLAKADSVKLGSLQANDVSVVVQKDQNNLYGNADGLLGMSFLSRFSVTLADGFVVVTSKLH